MCLFTVFIGWPTSLCKTQPLAWRNDALSNVSTLLPTIYNSYNATSSFKVPSTQPLCFDCQLLPWPGLLLCPPLITQILVPWPISRHPASAGTVLTNLGCHHHFPAKIWLQWRHTISAVTYSAWTVEALPHVPHTQFLQLDPKWNTWNKVQIKGIVRSLWMP